VGIPGCCVSRVLHPAGIGSAAMFLRFDILKKLADGGVVWIEAVNDLETARARIALFASQKPGEYVVFSQETQALLELPWVPYARDEKHTGECVVAKKKMLMPGNTKKISGKTRVDAETVQTVAKIVADVQKQAGRK
jgi:hypothetical protein